MPEVSLITPTGGRPEAFALCQNWVHHQTYKGSIEWIVVDDCDPPTPMTMGQKVIRPPERWSAEKGSSQHDNVLLALGYARGKYIFILEDDDYFGPSYLENQIEHLKDHYLVGETPSRYFHVGARVWREFANDDHASLCQTAFRWELIPLLSKICKERHWLDVTLWHRYGRSWGFLYPGDQVVGIKGMPGRLGVSRSHIVHHGHEWHEDPNLQQLQQWIGTDATKEYAKYAQ